MKKYFFPLLVLVLVTAGFFFRSHDACHKTSGQAQGTTYSVVYFAPANMYLDDTIQKILQYFDKSLSSYIGNSIISRINSNDTLVQTDELFNDVFILSKDIFRLSDGAFDITVAPLVNAWGFGWKKNKFPDKHVIDSIMEFVGMDKVKLDKNRIIKTDPRVQIDVNAVAQGYSVDIIARFLEKEGIGNYLVEVGGEVKCKGTKEKNKPWRIGIEKPDENNDIYDRPLQATVKLKNKSLATSGNYRKFYEKNGVKFVHTINPKTGKTIQSNLLSASVIADDCAKADALATTFMVLGLEKSTELVKTLPDIEVYFIYSDEKGAFKTWSTTGFQNLVEEIN